MVKYQSRIMLNAVNLETKLMFEGWAKLPHFRQKVARSQEIIQQALAIGQSYCAISWGKDSTVLLHMVQQFYPNILAAYHAHVERDMISNYSEVISAYTGKFSTNLLLIETTQADGNIGVAMDLHRNYPVCFLGLRAEESINRRRSLKSYGLTHQYTTGNLAGSYRVCPLGWWGWRDIWAYIVTNKLPYLKAYDQVDFGAHDSRTTCHISKTTNKQRQATRLESFKTLSPEYYNYLRVNYPEMF